MALAFRNATGQGNASGGALTVTKPTGVLDGDLLVVIAYLETDTNSWSSVGSGFTLLRSDVSTGNFRQDIYIKVASSEPASWTWTPAASAWRIVSVGAWSGNTGGGTFVDVHGGNSSATAVVSTSQTAPSVTTTAANDMLTFLYSNFSSVNVTGLTGAANTLRQAFGGQHIGDAIKAASGTVTGTTNPTSMGNTQFTAAHAALLLTSSGAGPTILLLNQMPNTLVRM